MLRNFLNPISSYDVKEISQQVIKHFEISHRALYITIVKFAVRVDTNFYYLIAIFQQGWKSCFGFFFTILGYYMPKYAVLI